MAKFNLQKGDKIFFNGNEGKVIDVNCEVGKEYATTYKIEIYKPFLMRFWVHNKQL